MLAEPDDPIDIELIEKHIDDIEQEHQQQITRFIDEQEHQQQITRFIDEQQHTTEQHARFKTDPALKYDEHAVQNTLEALSHRIQVSSRTIM
jgi:argonaute-like protein implicated in RNA metabolism and viral defense